MPMQSDRSGTTRRLSVTGWLGVAMSAVGGVLLFLGWLGVSGEPVVALQVPYLASASIPGASLVIGGAVLLGGESARRRAIDSAEMVATLYDLLTEASEPPPSDPTSEVGGAGNTELWALPVGTRFHRRGCALVEGKPDAVPVGRETIRARGLHPCAICDPVAHDE